MTRRYAVSQSLPVLSYSSDAPGSSSETQTPRHIAPVVVERWSDVQADNHRQPLQAAILRFMADQDSVVPWCALSLVCLAASAIRLGQCNMSKTLLIGFKQHYAAVFSLQLPPQSSVEHSGGLRGLCQHSLLLPCTGAVERLPQARLRQRQGLWGVSLGAITVLQSCAVHRRVISRYNGLC